MFRVQRFEVGGRETAVFADEFAVEPDFASAPFRTLNKHHVPMNGGATSVIALLVGLAGCEVQTTCDLLIKQDVAHRGEDMGIKSQRKFADVTRASVGIEDLV